DELTSRYHARFHVSADALEVEDLGSRNGTFVNGEKITGRVGVATGDRVRIGRELLEVIEQDADDGEGELRRTVTPGRSTQFPSLIGQLVDKALKVGNLKDAERYAAALVNQ